MFIIFFKGDLTESFNAQMINKQFSNALVPPAVKCITLSLSLFFLALPLSFSVTNR
jgi:hypothetical protein